MTSDNHEPAAVERPPANGRPPSRRRFRATWEVGVALLVTAWLGSAVYWKFFRPASAAPAPEEKRTESAFPPDPRLSYHGPFRNVHPDVAYVGDEQCVKCHQEIARTYARHPMGRSLVPVGAIAGRQLYDKAHNNPFEAFGIQFRIDRRGDRVYHRQTQLGADGKPVYDFAHEVDFVIGSGARGFSYLTTRDGFVFQTPVSWFGQKQIWDLSPGFPPWARAGRLVPGACLICHANRVEPVANTRNRFHEPVFRGHAIGCERCHGPGELHVRTLGKDDIVNPGRLEPALREAVCQQCHLQGATRVQRRGRGLNDYRPGMPLEEFLTVYVRGPGRGEENKAVNHVEQMYQSLCFRRSPAGKKMGCTTCHNPHEAVAGERRIAYYRDRCLRCHQEHGCDLPEETRRKKSPGDSCVACHMPRSASSDIVHTAATDHRILRKGGEAPTGREGEGDRPDGPLWDFHRGPPDLHDVGQGRDLGVALYQLTLRGDPLSGPDGELAVRLLSAALRDCPDDLGAREAKGKVLQALGRPTAAVEAFEALLRREPRHEGALVTLGAINRDLRRTGPALDYWRRAVEVNPQVAEYQKNLVRHLADRDAWDELRPHCRRWLDLDPASVEARHFWVQSLLKSGRKDEARVEFAKIRALRPPNLDKLEAWFAEQMR
jgi:tetratricopeptide (TPR) repeat protein